MATFLEETKKSLQSIAPEMGNIAKAIRLRMQLVHAELEDAMRSGRAPNFPTLQSVLDSLKENKVPDNNSEKCCAHTNLKVALVKTKQEKLSKVPEQKENIPEPEETCNDATFAIPQLPVKVKKIKKEPTQSTRVTRSKVKKQSASVQPDVDRESDIIVQDPHISVVDLVSSDEEKKEPVPVKQTKKRSKKVTKKTDEPVVEVKRETRSTRTKTNPVSKRHRNSDEEIENGKKKSRSCSSGKRSNGNCSTQTEYQDALSTVDDKIHTKTTTEVPDINVNDATFAVSNKPNFNETYDINKETVADKIQQQEQDLLTDDDSIEQPKLPPKPATGPKQVFSPYSNTPLKDKVKAFEQLGLQASNIPVKHKIGTPDNRSQAKHVTPITSKQLLKMNTLKTTPVTKHLSSSKDSLSVLSAKSVSAMKASQAEYLRRKEREQEALKKREQLLMAQSEEKRRKREERQLRAQQQREAHEQVKQKQFELQKQKYENHQQVIAEKERKILKAREENERKRLLAKKKVLEMREQEKNKIPKFKTHKTPLLPLADCYDSDDERHAKTKRILPLWAQEKVLNATMHAQLAIGEKIKNTLFSCSAQTPDLEELFGTMDPRKLKRSSSAIWNTPPRFTQSFKLCPTIEQGSDEENDN